jgi:predicted enzyme related to lactoylglutathione lyase
MKLSTEVYTSKVRESRDFYSKYFNFITKLETDGFVILQHKVHTAYEILFCVPNSPFVNEIFRPEYTGQGIIFQMEVEDIEKEYDRIKDMGVPIVLDLVSGSVNGKHFTIKDPNGILIDVVQYD